MIKSTIHEKIDSVLGPWVRARGAEPAPYAVDEPPRGVAADIACTAAMALARQMKKNPRVLAAELIDLIREPLTGIAEGFEIAGPGFINMRLTDAFLSAALARLARTGRARAGAPAAGKRVLLEFVSANPTGPMHIGHGRGAAIGDALGRIYAYRGDQVSREYYLNDTGNQIGMLARSFELRYRELGGETIEFPADGYQGAYITDAARALRDRVPAGPIDFKAEILREMTATIAADLERFRVSFDTWFSEARLTEQRDPVSGLTRVEETLRWLQEHQFAFELDGALWFASTRWGDDKDRVLRRSDGRTTYLASDIAYHRDKLDRGFDRLIDLWGADHHGYVPRMKAAVQALGHPAERLTVLLYQLVSLSRGGVPVAMSTRSGEFVTLEEVVREVGVDACRFFFLLRASDSSLEFDLELAKKKSSENPVFYVQYVHARCHSLFAEAQRTAPELQDRGAICERARYDLLTHAAERALIIKLLSLDDTVDLCAKTDSPHHLATYLMETADHFHRFYEHCRVVADDRSLTEARLALVQAVARTIAAGLDLLGVSAPERM